MPRTWKKEMTDEERIELSAKVCRKQQRETGKPCPVHPLIEDDGQMTLL